MNHHFQMNRLNDSAMSHIYKDSHQAAEQYNLQKELLKIPTTNAQTVYH